MRDQSIRRAEPNDLDQVWPLARDFATSFQPVRESFEPTFHRLLDSPGALFLVCVDGEIVHGYLVAHVHDTFLANGPVAWIEEVMVDELHRGLGIGRALMSKAEEWATSMGGVYISLASRRAGAFYLALGYGESATYYKKATPPAR